MRTFRLPVLLHVALAAMLMVLALGTRAVATPEEAQPARSTCTELPKGSPGDVVRRLYADYPVNDDRQRLPFWNEKPDVLSRYFDAKLTGLFLADQACQERWRGPCAITVNLLCICQAGDPTDIRFCRSNRGPEWVDVRFMIFKKERVIPFLTSKTAAGWRISDIHFPEGGSLVQTFTHPPY
jgi:hypothetical protein